MERLVQLRFGPLDDGRSARIAGASADELERFIERVVTAESVDDVFV